MNVRVIAGRYGGRVLDAPGRQSTHAMSERVRNALFNSLGDEINGAAVLDAFAGSGSLGIEALSRGAASAFFIEKDRIAAKIITKNLAALGAEGHVVHTTVRNWLSTADDNQLFDIIFADPPYRDPQVGTLQMLQSRLSNGGLIVVSHPKNVTIEPGAELKWLDTRIYGTALLTFLRRSG